MKTFSYSAATLLSRQFAKLSIEDFEITSENNVCIAIHNDNYLMLNLTIYPEKVTEEFIESFDENTVLLSFNQVPTSLVKYHGKKIFYVSNLKELVEDNLK